MSLEVAKFTWMMKLSLDPNEFKKILIHFLSKASGNSEYTGRSFSEKPYNCHPQRYSELIQTQFPTTCSNISPASHRCHSSVPSNLNCSRMQWSVQRKGTVPASHFLPSLRYWWVSVGQEQTSQPV